MSAVSLSEERVVSRDRSEDKGLMPKILLGLLLLMVFSFLAGPATPTGAPIVTHVTMIAVFVTASAAYLMSFVEPGDVTGVVIDKERGVVTLEKTGLFARSTRRVAFEEIAAVKMESRTDKQGFQTAMPMLVLKSERFLPLPAGTTEADIASMRAMIGAV